MKNTRAKCNSCSKPGIFHTTLIMYTDGYTIWLLCSLRYSLGFILDQDMQHHTCLCIFHKPMLMEESVTGMHESRVSCRLHVILKLINRSKILFNNTTITRIQNILFIDRETGSALLLLFLLYGQYANRKQLCSLQNYGDGGNCLSSLYSDYYVCSDFSKFLL